MESLPWSSNLGRFATGSSTSSFSSAAAAMKQLFSHNVQSNFPNIWIGTSSSSGKSLLHFVAVGLLLSQQLLLEVLLADIILWRLPRLSIGIKGKNCRKPIEKMALENQTWSSWEPRWSSWHCKTLWEFWHFPMPGWRWACGHWSWLFLLFFFNKKEQNNKK